MPLGSLLGPLEALLGGLKSEKMPTVPRENHFFINTGFWFFEDPNGPLGLILVPLGQIWSQNGSQHGSKSDQKVGQKFIKKTIKNGSPPGYHLGFQFFIKSRSPAKGIFYHCFNFVFHLFFIFFSGFGSLWVPLGSLLGLLAVLLGGLWTQKC